ncbi:MAG: hypothetical protein AB7L90_07230 [Hyphomicrobiaceae bacterium]|uniref:hypothetical protein n=1 Tax=Pseudorhodoplanes sp. TaxID=1934341 RepID=UPI003D09B3FF
MSTTEQRLAANRANAQRSAGPTTAEGKAMASRNATRHGLLSGRLLLEDEDRSEFEELTDDLCHSLRPVGIAEAALVERIATTIWRQRRLVRAETAAITLAREAVPTAKSVSTELGRGYSSEIKLADLQPFSADREAWCKTAMAEIEALEEIDLRSLEASAPTVYDQLLTDADGDTAEKFLAGHTGGLTGYIAELTIWCRKELREAETRPKLLAITEQVRARASVLPAGTLEVLSRYQTTLDNQLFKALRALREAQEWRLKTIEPIPPTPADEQTLSVVELA